MHASASYHNALSSLTRNQNKTSEKRLGKCHLQTGYSGLEKLIAWLNHQSHNSFDSNRINFQALDSRKTVDDLTTCDSA